MHFTDLVVSPGPGAGPQVVPIVEYLVVAAPEVIITHNTDSALLHVHLRDKLDRKVTWGSAAAGEAATTMAQPCILGPVTFALV